MHDKQISDQLNSEHSRFVNSIYSGKIAPPHNILEMFKNALLAMPPFAHKIMFSKVRTIMSKEVEELTNDDLSDIIRVVLNISLERLYPYSSDFEQMVEDQIYMDKFVLCFNTAVETFKQSLNQKRERLQSLAGGVNSNGSGLRIS